MAIRFYYLVIIALFNSGCGSSSGGSDIASEGRVNSSISDVEFVADKEVADPLRIMALGDSICLLYTSPSPRDGLLSRMPSSA